MAKKEQLNPENNNQVENSGDEPLKVEETTQSPQEQDPAEEAVGEKTFEKMTDASQEASSEKPLEENLENYQDELLMEVLEEPIVTHAEATTGLDEHAELEIQTTSEDNTEEKKHDVSEVDVEVEIETEAEPEVETESLEQHESQEYMANESIETVEAVQETQADLKDDATYSQSESESQEFEAKKPEMEASTHEAVIDEVEETTEADGKTEIVEVIEEKESSKEDEKAQEPLAEEIQQQTETPEEDSAQEKLEEKPEVVKDYFKKIADNDNQEKEEDYAEKFSNLTREELVLAIEALVKNEDVSFIRKQIGLIKVAYHKLTRSEKEKLADQSLEAGNEISDASEFESDQLDPLKIRFDEAFTVYKSKKSEFDQSLESQKQENLNAKKAILEELRNLIESEEELKKTYDQFRDLQERWRRIGAVPQLSKNDLWNNYHFLIEKFFDKVKINNELKDLDLKKNLELKTELCEKAEELLLETSIVNSFQKLQKLHETWKETGPVPNDKKDEIWERFRAATVMLNHRREEHYSGLSQEQDKNYAAKVVLCEKVEQIAELGADNPRKWQEQTNEINELFKVWKTIGFAPKKVNNEIWNRFRAALNTFFRNKKEYLNKFKDIQTENYNQKLNLCIQAEALKDSTDWGKATNEFILLQNQWKGIGQVPPKFSDKIWKRFRSACDEFFNRKSEFFANIDKSQDDNLKIKKELIEKIKNHPYSDDNTENLKVLNEFQRQWMEVGHVPIKQKDKIHIEFRKTIDEKFESLGISRTAKSAQSFRNKLDNIRSNPNADNIIYKERTFLLNKISQLQNDLNLWENNIGFFASSKKADLLKKEFEDKIEKAKQDIAIMGEKLKILREQ